MENCKDKIKNRKKHWDISGNDDALNFVTSYRNELSYSKHTRDIIKLITVNDGFPGAIAGSGKFRVQTYPGDVDLMEKIEVCCSKDDISNFITERIQKIAKDIKSSDKVYLGDFKAGLDERYKMNIGWINLNQKLVGYNKRDVKNELNRLHSEKLLSKTELDKMLALLPPNAKDRHIPQWEQLKDAYRKYYVVRWSIDALIKGYKNIGPKNNKVRLDLNQAVRHRTVVKMDVWAEVDKNFYTEVTNVLVLVWSKTKGGKKIFLNLPMGDYKHAMINEIRHYGLGQHPNYMKALKRMWSLTTHLNIEKRGSQKEDHSSRQA